MIVKYVVKILKKISKLTSFDYFNFLANTTMTNYLNKKYFNGLDCIEENTTEPAKYIWVCWFQGEKEAPEIVRECVKSIRTKSPDDFKVVFIDESNFREYVDLDEVICQKYNSGIITKAQMSDILRFYLWKEYGGLWIDSTIFLKNNIILNEIDLFKPFSLTNKLKVPLDSIACGRWTGYFFYFPKNYSITNYFCNAMVKYWREEDVLIDYFFIDYIILSAYLKNESFRVDVKKNSIINENKFLLKECLMHTCPQVDINTIKDDSIGIYKLSHKEKYINEIKDLI